VFYEDFNDNSAGWSIGPDWGIGPAVSFVCPSCGTDPGTDHTATGDNGLAGVFIGGCTANLPLFYPTFRCLTSPVVNTASMPTVFLTYWRYLQTDYPSFIHSIIEVWNGSVWTNVFTNTGGCIVDPDWSQQTLDLTAHKHANMQVRWCYSVGSDGNWSSAGWSIDDVTIAPQTCDGP
jgi:hypothetical protein